ncbi:Sigma factor binding protein 1, chloroplastic [Apostasia shenzhenica]|uniref:Sigma factor binding protein 1, chloroplastic n=1 Tax=Apostasia shenzhenica TaxID=1088818 RepID=A0A2H9ZXX7_9ASPA|nr:Sigma factor binding protein 1, chloroplastic [Apostasia shenzhenica]
MKKKKAFKQSNNNPPMMKPMKVVYFSNPMRVTTTASAFRSLVQELTGRHSVIADELITPPPPPPPLPTASAAGFLSPAGELCFGPCCCVDPFGTLEDFAGQHWPETVPYEPPHLHGAEELCCWPA